MILTIIIGKNLVNRVCVSVLRLFETPNVNVLGAHMYMWYVHLYVYACMHGMICSFRSDSLYTLCKVVVVCALSVCVCVCVCVRNCLAP